MFSILKSYRCKSCSGPLMKSPSSQYTCLDCKQEGKPDKKNAERASNLFKQGLDCLNENKIKGTLLEWGYGLGVYNVIMRLYLHIKIMTTFSTFLCMNINTLYSIFLLYKPHLIKVAI